MENQGIQLPKKFLELSGITRQLKPAIPGQRRDLLKDVMLT
jgi:hypothetical protein